jgi:hypothetical protein
MFEIAYANKEIKGSEFKVSALCKESTDEYIEENNLFKFWFDTTYQRVILPSNFKQLKKDEREQYIIRIKTSTLLNEYNSGKEKHEHLTAKKLKNALIFNDIDISTYNGSATIKGWEKKAEGEEVVVDELDEY